MHHGHMRDSNSGSSFPGIQSRGSALGLPRRFAGPPVGTLALALAPVLAKVRVASVSLCAHPRLVHGRVLSTPPFSCHWVGTTQMNLGPSSEQNKVMAVARRHSHARGPLPRNPPQRKTGFKSGDGHPRYSATFFVRGGPGGRTPKVKPPTPSTQLCPLLYLLYTRHGAYNYYSLSKLRGPVGLNTLPKKNSSKRNRTVCAPLVLGTRHSDLTQVTNLAVVSPSMGVSPR